MAKPPQLSRVAHPEVKLLFLVPRPLFLASAGEHLLSFSRFHSTGSCSSCTIMKLASHIPRMASAFCLPLAIASTLAQYTNLPDVAPGLFNVSARIQIDNTNISAAWDALTNFPDYPKWNPFVRSSVVVDSRNIISIQRPVENSQLLLCVQLPALPLPVNENTQGNPLNTQLSYENVTHVQPERGRLAWEYYPNPLMAAERWQALSVNGNGQVLYESREVFSGTLAPLTQKLYQQKLQESFNAQAQGLRLWLQGGYRP
ncbi:hypothetical protein PMIN03_000991 [Paraphaeosphaeria minitans]